MSARPMHSVVQSRAFTSKCRGKYSDKQIEDLVEALGQDPRRGRQLRSANTVYQYPWGHMSKRKQDYDVYYVFHSPNAPILIVNIFKRDEKDVLLKILATLADEITKV